ncbi:hypothetical protein TPY_2716 [Sulfobacillus acidophilus TPY]|nr:hypothetical protein TPY_2716 [Sulfobacillus acidophilus TPY]
MDDQRVSPTEYLTPPIQASDGWLSGVALCLVVLIFLAVGVLI